MPDTTTPNLGLTKPENFASTNTWGDKLNTNLDLIDEAIQDAQDVADAAAPKTTTLGSADGSITGLGPLTSDLLNIASAPNKTIQRVEVYVNGASVGTAKRVNYQDGAFLSFSGVQDDADTITIAATGADSETEITESLSTLGKTSSISRVGFDGQFITTTAAAKATVPAGRICIRPLVVVTNNSSTDEGVNCWFNSAGGSAGNASKVWSSGYLKVPAGRSIVIGEGRMHILGAGATIILQAESTTTVLSCRISMETVPDSNAAFLETTPGALTTALQTFRTVAAKTSRVCWIAHNYSASHVGLTVAYRPSGAGADSAAYNVGFYNGVALLEPGQTIVYDQPDVLNAGDLIRASASVGSSVSFRLSVLELA